MNNKYYSHYLLGVATILGVTVTLARGSTAVLRTLDTINLAALIVRQGRIRTSDQTDENERSRIKCHVTFSTVLIMMAEQEPESKKRKVQVIL